METVLDFIAGVAAWIIVCALIVLAISAVVLGFLMLCAVDLVQSWWPE